MADIVAMLWIMKNAPTSFGGRSRAIMAFISSPRIMAIIWPDVAHIPSDINFFFKDAKVRYAKKEGGWEVIFSVGYRYFL